MAKQSRKPDTGPTRCAIYTRKSTEEGLEQDFNSLDAQREACDAYIVSQRHEGWTLVPEFYDDGGFSGGNMDRPGLVQLLADVKAGKVDVIVVYKVDRLTRSLADFAKMVDVLDAAGASFVSVTQAFNTTTSMGRLTLNVLLSFAQFEREVTGERIRDKIAASKARGMWMGGSVPMGYEVRDRKLYIRTDEAERVRSIFARYLELRSVPVLADELYDAGVRSRTRTSRSGRTFGGVPIMRGALYALLQNRIYLGEIVHKARAYPGEHEAIIGPELFEQVQRTLEANRVARTNGCHASAPSLLKGLVKDRFGRRMSPDHCCKHGRRYRYYASRQDSMGDREQPKWRVPAVDLEEIVIGQLVGILRDREALAHRHNISPDQLHGLFADYEDQAQRLATGSPQDQSELIRDLVERIVVDQDRIVIIACLRRQVDEERTEPDCMHQIELAVTARIVRAGIRTRIAIPPTQDAQTVRRDPPLIRLIAKAHGARRAVEASSEDVNSVAAAEGHDKDYFGRLVRLGYLAPDIVTAIIEGRQPATLTRQRLARLSKLPIDWAQQRQLLGFC